MIKTQHLVDSLVVQWFEIHASIAGGMGLIHGQGIKIPKAAQPKQNKSLKF